MRFMTSGVSMGTTSSARMFSVTCDGRLAPVITVVTWGFFRHHAMASCARVQPTDSATVRSRRTLATLAGSTRSLWSHS